MASPLNLQYWKLALEILKHLDWFRNFSANWSARNLSGHRECCCFDLPMIPFDSPVDSPDDDMRLYGSIACDGKIFFFSNSITTGEICNVSNNFNFWEVINEAAYFNNIPCLCTWNTLQFRLKIWYNFRSLRLRSHLYRSLQAGKWTSRNDSRKTLRLEPCIAIHKELLTDIL